MEKTDCFRASDGELFEVEQDALVHDNFLEYRQYRIDSGQPPTPADAIGRAQWQSIYEFFNRGK